MKLRNKRTGEILGSLGSFIIQNPNHINCEAITKYNSLAELNAEWEDYEEPKDHWHIGCEGDVFIDNTERYLSSYSSIGNDFETREEAEKAVEKLKALKRLKDKGFSFGDWNWETQCIEFDFDNPDITEEQVEEANKDLDLLFGGEE